MSSIRYEINGFIYFLLQTRTDMQNWAKFLKSRSWLEQKINKLFFFQLGNNFSYFPVRARKKLVKLVAKESHMLKEYILHKSQNKCSSLLVPLCHFVTHKAIGIHLVPKAIRDEETLSLNLATLNI